MVIAYGIMKIKKYLGVDSMVFNERVMYKDQFQGKKEENENIEYPMLDDIKENEVPKVPENKEHKQV